MMGDTPHTPKTYPRDDTNDQNTYGISPRPSSQGTLFSS